ncbi:DUF6011 domain-containing protein [Zoogloea oleivorans]|jgi:hypothetical protein|uniref:DUF6011 domain-containing protein n=1 Tax=Zoogloea oleivorans TaxID=1552750 RepID=UPI00387E07C9
MICANCNRPLKSPAAMLWRMAFGPTCARKLSLLAPPAVRHAAWDVRSRERRDTQTMDLFVDLAAEPK